MSFTIGGGFRAYYSEGSACSVVDHHPSLFSKPYNALLGFDASALGKWGKDVLKSERAQERESNNPKCHQITIVVSFSIALRRWVEVRDSVEFSNQRAKLRGCDMYSRQGDQNSERQLCRTPR